MATASGAGVFPLSNGGVEVRNNAGTVLLTVSSTGVVTYGAATTVGAIRLQSLTTTQRDALTGVAGMLIFNSTTSKLNFYSGAAWEAVTSA